MHKIRALAPLLAVWLLAACAETASPVASVPPASAPMAAGESGHHHELHLPPVGPTLRVTLGGKAVDVPIATLPHEGSQAPLLALWKAAWPAEDPTPLHFDLTGSDGFHPASRPPCARLLTGPEVALAHIDVVTHDVTFDPSLQLPGCYRVKAVVAMDGSR